MISATGRVTLWYNFLCTFKLDLLLNIIKKYFSFRLSAGLLFDLLYSLYIMKLYLDHSLYNIMYDLNHSLYNIKILDLYNFLYSIKFVLKQYIIVISTSSDLLFDFYLSFYSIRLDLVLYIIKEYSWFRPSADLIFD